MYHKGSKKRALLADVMIEGTTFTGHPTRTTLGNTLRSYLYAKFIARKAGIPKNKIQMLCSGDDMMIFVERECLEAFKKSLFEYISFDEKASYEDP